MAQMHRPSRSRATLLATGMALIVATVVGYATRRYLLPNASAESTVAIIWWIALAIALIGLVGTWRQERVLGRESRLLARLRTASLTEELDRIDKADAPSSVVYRHAHLVSGALQTGHVPPGDFRADWRRIAIERTAHFGATQRFLASSLLLLAVLGTFAGLKSALPYLNDALTNEVSQGRGASSAVSPVQAAQDAFGTSQARDGSASAVTSALDLVANAFGANFLALLASLVLGAAGFGLSRERRELLMELDDVASRIWYPLLPTDAGLSTLERAVVEMRGSAVEVGRVGDSIGSLNRRLEDFKTTLVDAMQSMVGDVRASVQASSIAADRRHESQLTELARTLGLITKALERTSVGYEGLVKGLEERDLGVTAAAKALEQSAQQALSAGATLVTASRELLALRQDGEQRDREVRTEIAGLLELLQEAAKGVEASAASQSTALLNATRVLDGFRREQQANWERAATNADAQLQAINTNGGRVDRLATNIEELRNVEVGVRGELAELQTAVRQQIDKLMAPVEQTARVSRELQSLVDTQVGEIRTGLRDKLARLVAAGERQCEVIEAGGGAQRRSLEELQQQIELYGGSQLQALLALREALEQLHTTTQVEAEQTRAALVATRARHDPNQNAASPASVIGD